MELEPELKYVDVSWKGSAYIVTFISLILFSIIYYKTIIKFTNFKHKREFVYIAFISYLFYMCVDAHNDRSKFIEDGKCLISGNKLKNGIFYGGCVDTFHVTHFLLYTFFGIIYPNDYVAIIIFSIVHELFEHYLFKKYRTCSDNYCGRYEDPFINLTGYFIGSQIACELNKK